MSHEKSLSPCKQIGVREVEAHLRKQKKLIKVLRDRAYTALGEVVMCVMRRPRVAWADVLLLAEVAASKIVDEVAAAGEVSLPQLVVILRARHKPTFEDGLKFLAVVVLHKKKISEIVEEAVRLAANAARYELDAANPDVARAAKFSSEAEKWVSSSGVPRLFGTPYDIVSANPVRYWALQSVGHSTAARSAIRGEVSGPCEAGIPGAIAGSSIDYRARAVWWLTLFGPLDQRTLVPLKVAAIDEKDRPDWVIGQLLTRTEAVIEGDYQRAERDIGLSPFKLKDPTWHYLRGKRIEAVRHHPDSLGLFKRAEKHRQIYRLVEALGFIPILSSQQGVAPNPSL